MKLKDSFMTQEVDGIQFLVPVGQEFFSGIVRSNPTAAFIVDWLKQDTSEEAIVEAMSREYDAPRERSAADVAEILGILRRIRALEE